MQTEIKKIINQIFKEQQFDKIKETENKIKKHLGDGFLERHIEQIFLHKNKIIIKTKTIESKTEINLLKTKIGKEVIVK